MTEEENYSLVKGSIYKVRSAGSTDAMVETEGEFLGYQQFGDESALAIKSLESENKGAVRIIPCSAVLYVDVIKQEKESKKVKSKNEKVEFYG